MNDFDSRIYKSRNFVKNGNLLPPEPLRIIYKSRNFVKNGNNSIDVALVLSTRVEIL